MNGNYFVWSFCHRSMMSSQEYESWFFQTEKNDNKNWNAKKVFQGSGEDDKQDFFYLIF